MKWNEDDWKPFIEGDGDVLLNCNSMILQIVYIIAFIGQNVVVFLSAIAEGKKRRPHEQWTYWILPVLYSGIT